MTKIFFYELRRLLLRKFFWGLLVVTLVYAYQLLDSEVILGIANTAPFSPWSYAWYLSKCLPLLLVTLCFFVSALYSKKEKKVQVLINTTPADLRLYRLVRCLTMLCGLLILILAVIVPSFVFYSQVFKFNRFMELLLPMGISLLPPIIFVMGLSLFSGKYSTVLQYALVLAVLLAGVALGSGFDLLGTNFYTQYPLSLDLGMNGEPGFVLPLSFLLQRLVLTLLGLGLWIFA